MRPSIPTISHLPPTIYTTLAGYGIAERDGERCGSEPRASVTERALRALLDEFTAAVQALGATGGDADLYGRLRVRLEA